MEQEKTDETTTSTIPKILMWTIRTQASRANACTGRNLRRLVERIANTHLRSKRGSCTDR